MTTLSEKFEIAKQELTELEEQLSKRGDAYCIGYLIAMMQNIIVLDLGYKKFEEVIETIREHKANAIKRNKGEEDDA